jgi:electron transport complex protein RnfE
LSAKVTSLLTGITMGMSAMCVMIMTVVTLSCCRRYVSYSFRLPVVLIISVTWVIVLDLLMQAYWYEMREVLGIYLPLLAMNSFILLLLQQTALTKAPLLALNVTLRRGMLVAVLAGILGASRELIGLGGLLNDADILLGKSFESFSLVDGGLVVIYKTPGALIGLALIIAAYKHFLPTHFVRYAD